MNGFLQSKIFCTWSSMYRTKCFAPIQLRFVECDVLKHVAGKRCPLWIQNGHLLLCPTQTFTGGISYMREKDVPLDGGTLACCTLLEARHILHLTSLQSFTPRERDKHDIGIISFELEPLQCTKICFAAMLSITSWQSKGSCPYREQQPVRRCHLPPYGGNITWHLAYATVSMYKPDAVIVERTLHVRIFRETIYRPFR